MRADDFKEEIDDIFDCQDPDVSRGIVVVNAVTGEQLFVETVRLGDNGDIEIVANT